MRRVVFGIIFIALFVIACSAGREQTIKAQEPAKLFLAINDGANYADKVFSGSEAASIADLVKAECPQGVGDTFVRATLDSKAWTFVLYTTKDGKNVTCSVLKPKTAKTITTKTLKDAPDNDTALTVNGNVVTITNLRAAISALPQSTPRDNNAIAQVANQLVNDELLRQQAEKMTVSDAEIAKMRSQIIAQANLTEETLPPAIKPGGVNAPVFEKQVVAQAKLQKLLDTRLLLKDVTVTDAQAQSYYMANPTQFLRTEQAVMRQVFIASANRSQAQVVARAQAAFALLNNTDFCEIVKRYSDDNQGQTNCGVYVIPRGVIDPNLELASFSTPANQTSVVNAADGVHLVQTMKVVPAQVVPYTDVAGQLQDSLRNSIFQQRLSLYLATLRADADITSYLG